MIMCSAQLGPLCDCTTCYTSVLSSERAPHFNNQAVVKLKEKRKNLLTGLRCVPDTKPDLPTNRWSQYHERFLVVGVVGELS
jgi:hypothetical protein